MRGLDFDPVWQMSRGEQAAISGLLGQLQPSLAIELGTAAGAGARRLASLVGELHVFDLQPPELEMPANVVLHLGDSHETLPRFLAEQAEQGRNVDFALVDGDHKPSGVRQDIEDLLDSPAVGQAVIAIHDVTNERVRIGVDAVRFAAWPKVAYVHLDWIPGQLFREPGLEHELWYGLGLVVVDSARAAYDNGEVHEQRYYPMMPLLSDGREAMLTRPGGGEKHPAGVPDELEDMRWELDLAREEAEAERRQLAWLVSSRSWRATAPLRRTSQRLARVRRALRR